jgi:hypothetical protein
MSDFVALIEAEEQNLERAAQTVNARFRRAQNAAEELLELRRGLHKLLARGSRQSYEQTNISDRSGRFFEAGWVGAFRYPQKKAPSTRRHKQIRQLASQNFEFCR